MNSFGATGGAYLQYKSNDHDDISQKKSGKFSLQ